MSTSCNLVRIFGKEKKNDTKLIRVPIDDPRCSGDALWEFHFLIAIGYPDIAEEERRVRVAQWLDLLDVIYPSAPCCCSYKQHRMKYDLAEVASGRGAMLSYFVELYNSVAENLPHMKKTTVEEVIEKYGTKLVDPSKRIYNSCVV